MKCQNILESVAFALAIFCACGATIAQQPVADLIIEGGDIATMDAARPSAESIAIKDGRILAVGGNRSINKFKGEETETLTLDGEFVMPGFIEGHAHFLGLGESLMMLRLAEASSWEEIVQWVVEASEIAEPGEWIVGRGWHQSKWSHTPQPNINGYPILTELSRRTPNNPVLLTHASGHMCVANDYAMRLAGVDKETADPDGGEILRTATGELAGVFRETAEELINKAMAKDLAKRSSAEQRATSYRAIELASNECLKHGVTSFQDAGTKFVGIDILKRAADENRLGVRLWAMIRDRNENLKRLLPNYKLVGYGNDFLTVRAVKRSIDGALGPHGAWLLAPYSDLPTSSGLNTATVESVMETAEIAIKNDFQVCVHAIGDRANREVLDVYEKLFAKYPSSLPRRWRVEHAQHLHPDDIARFGKMGVIAAMQGVHCTSDAIFVPKRLGMKRSKDGAYVWKSLIDSGAIVTNGTDAPVESIDPIASFYASVTRRMNKDVTFFPEQCMTRMQALRSYTIDCAYSAFEESVKGSLVPGKFADITILSNNLLTCQDDEILDTKILYTIVDGKIVYKNESK